MDWGQAGTIGGGLLFAAAAVLSYFKFKPGQRERVEAETGLAEVDIAAGTLKITEAAFDLVATNLREELARVSEGARQAREDLAVLRGEFEQYRRDTDNEFTLLRTQLRAEKAEKVAVKRENEKLRARVAELEAEVVGLRAEVDRLRDGQP